MKTVAFALAAVLAAAAAPAFAQPPTADAVAAAPASKVSVTATKISDIVANPAAKAKLEALMPQIADYYSQIGDMTLADVAPLSQGAITEETLKTLQAEFDKL